jgi:restriction endonuclease
MAGSKDSSEVSTSNIITPTWETLPAEEQLLFEERQEQLIQEANAKFLSDFKVDMNNKVVRQRATDPASLRPTTITPNVSNTNELQSLRAYIDEQREQLQHIVGDIQNDHKRLVRVHDKSTMANLPSHEVELREYTHNSSATGCHDQSQPLYGMPMDMYPTTASHAHGQ